MKLNVGILRGGVSPEYETSIKSGGQALFHLNRDKYRPIDLLVSRDGVLHADGAPIEGKNLRGIDELIRPMKLKTPPPKKPIPFVARFHLHPSVRARISETQTAQMETPGGQSWRFKTDARSVAIEPSIYWGGSAPRDGLQIVLSGRADPMGHGLAPPNRIRWALARLN